MGDRSVNARDISQSVVVTGDGNNVALTFGDTGIRLPLRRKQLPPPERLVARTRRAWPAFDARYLPITSPNQFPIISRLRQINSRFGQINSRFHLTGIGA
jgi:hypothetical protein